MESNWSALKSTVGTSQQAAETASSELHCSNNVVDDKEISQVVQKEAGKAVHWRRNKNNIDEHSCILQILPPGYRYCPVDHELIQSYLRRKVLNHELPLNRIYDVNLYNYNPYDLARQCEPWGDKVWYFFTPRDRKYPNGKRPSRTAGDGFWKATGADKNIVDAGERVIGARKALVFYRGTQTGNGTKTNWIMHEYRIDGLEENTSTRTEHNMRLDDWVLCKVYQKKRKAKVGGDDSSDTNENVDDRQASQSPASSPSTQPAPEVHPGNAVRAGTSSSSMQLMLTGPAPSPAPSKQPGTILHGAQPRYSSTTAPMQVNIPAPVGINDNILDQPKPINVSFPFNPEEDYLDYMFVDDMFYQPMDGFCNPYNCSHQTNFPLDEDRKREDHH